MEPRHRAALDAAVAALHEEFGDDLAGLLLTGSLARGEGDVNSDLDLYVLVDRPWRQRRTRWIDGVEVELFLNPVARIGYAMTEDGDTHCAHMFVTGRAIYDRDGAVARLQETAADLLAAGPPEPAPYELLMARYRPADLLADARDVAADPAACAAMISLTLWVTLEAHYAIARRWWPKQKRLLADLEAWDAETAALARATLDQATGLDARLDALEQLVDRVLRPAGGRLGEWESEREPVAPDGSLGQ